MEVGTSTASQGRSCLEVHILDSIPQLGFNVALQHPCPKEIYPSPSSATSYCLFFEEPKYYLWTCVKGLAHLWNWDQNGGAQHSLCAVAKVSSHLKNSCVALQRRPSSKSSSGNHAFTAAQLLYFNFRYMQEGNIDHRFLYPNAWSHRMPDCAFCFLS